MGGPGACTSLVHLDVAGHDRLEQLCMGGKAGSLETQWLCMKKHTEFETMQGLFGVAGSLCMKDICQGIEQTAAFGGDVHGWRRKQLEGMREKHGLLGCCSCMRAGKKPKPSLEGKKEDQVLRCAWTKRKPCKRAG